MHTKTKRGLCRNDVCMGYSTMTEAEKYRYRHANYFTATWDAQSKPIWKCNNCGHETPRRSQKEQTTFTKRDHVIARLKELASSEHFRVETRTLMNGTIMVSAMPNRWFDDMVIAMVGPRGAVTCTVHSKKAKKTKGSSAWTTWRVYTN